jgi:YD repeat-containing protein
MHGLKRAEAAGYPVPPLLDWTILFDDGLSFAITLQEDQYAGALATITDPVGLTTTLTYNTSGFISTITDPADRTTTLTVGTDGNITAVEDPNGSTTDYGHSTPSDHLATTETDPNGNTATAHYNSFGQLTSETLFGDTGTTSTDAALRNGLSAPGGSGSLSTSYAGSITDPDGRTTTVSFNSMSLPTGEDEANGGSTSATYNSEGFPVSETDALGRTVMYTYNSAGDVTSITEVTATGSTSPVGGGGVGPQLQGHRILNSTLEEYYLTILVVTRALHASDLNTFSQLVSRLSPRYPHPKPR